MSARHEAVQDAVSWRAERLLRAGFDRDCAETIASRLDTDLHALIELVESGCPPHLAVRILAPLD
jgi:hypothetical protein